MFKIKQFELSEKRICSIQNIIQNNSSNFDNICRRWDELLSKEYTCLVLNFDGTIRVKEIRVGPIDKKIVIEMVRLYNNQIKLIIATGRRDSASSIIQKIVNKYNLEITMILGNGLEILSLPSNKRICLEKSFSQNETKKIHNCLINQCKFKKNQIRPSGEMIRVFLNSDKDAKSKVLEVIKNFNNEFLDYNITNSGLNIEILKKGISKNKALRQILNKKENVLVIGDSGAKSGNDFDILSKYSSFCVGECPEEFLNWSLPVIDENGKILLGPMATEYVLKRCK